MIILAIETSCDDTSVALIEAKEKKRPKFRVLSNIVSSQVKVHAKYGGIYPLLAKREHQKNLPLVLEKALKISGSTRIDLVAITAGPGLEPCLWVGVNFAKNLAKKLSIPLVPVNHIEAHIFANWLPPAEVNLKEIIPALCLIVSGGHTQLILMRDIGDYKIVGETRDDAAGESFDKIARILGLGFPGGPEIEAEAEKLKIENSKLKIELPRPMIYQKNYDFSFSGLKTAALYHFQNQNPKKRKSKKYIREMAKEVQSSIIDVLLHKTLKAAKDYGVKSIILGGGVTANKELRKQFKKESKKAGFKLLVPQRKFSTDNAAMIGVAAFFNWQPRKQKGQKDIEAEPNLRLK